MSLRRQSDQFLSKSGLSWLERKRRLRRRAVEFDVCDANGEFVCLLGDMCRARGECALGRGQGNDSPLLPANYGGLLPLLELKEGQTGTMWYLCMLEVRPHSSGLLAFHLSVLYVSVLSIFYPSIFLYALPTHPSFIFSSLFHSSFCSVPPPHFSISPSIRLSLCLSLHLFPSILPSIQKSTS